MVIAAVCTAYNEADIIGLTIGHLLAEGIDRVYVAHGPSTDGTGDVLRSFDRVVIVPDWTDFHDQPRRTRDLSERASADGAEWVVPFDADEFVYAPNNTIATALRALPDKVTKLRIERWIHGDVDHRRPEQERLPKVAWRANLPIVTWPGNHEVTIDGDTAEGVLFIRELQFRSFEHLERKCQERVARIDPAFGPEYGTHQRDLAVMSSPRRYKAWMDYQAAATVYDPIPTVVI